MSKELIGLKKKKLSLIALFTTVVLAFPIAYQKAIFFIASKEAPPTPDNQTFAWKEGNVSYTCAGTGRPILLLHNTQIGANKKEWEKVMEELSKQFQVYAVDLPGYGESEKPKITYTAYQYTLFINAFIQQVIQQPTIVFGSSQSADFALMACRMQPENFKKLVCISPSAPGSPMATNQDARYKLLLQSPIAGTHFYLQRSSKKAIAHMLRQESFFAQELVTQELIDAYYYAAHKGGENARFAYASAASRFLNTQLQEAFASICVPFLMVWGRDNQINPLENMALFEKLRPRGQYAVFDNTRMLPHYENSSDFVEAVLRFIK